MENRSTLGALLVTLLPAAIIPGLLWVGPLGTTRPATPSDSGGGPRDAAAALQAVSAMELIDRYARDDIAKPGVGRPDAATAPIVRALIVTVPDPLDAPHLDWAYDASISSIQRAAETSEFLIDRFWLPWIGDAVRDKDGHYTNLRGANPGVMLFRSTRHDSTAHRDTLLVVFVVGETPTTGINKRAFQAALRQVDTLAKNGLLLSKPCDTLRIVGPYYTGSARSLRVALQAKKGWDLFKHIEVVSGSATQDAIRDELQEVPHLQFHATVNSDNNYNAVLFEAIADRLRVDATEIVLLVESSTAYGRGCHGNRAATCTEGKAAATADTTSMLMGTLVPFPMHIASLRDQQDGSSESMAVTESRRVPFSISLKEPGTAIERPPSASALTPASVSLIIDEIAHVIAARHARAVGIFATDIRDKLFLAREVRLRLPDVQLFTTEANILYLWPEYNEALRGMLIASTYPLSLEVRSWQAKPGLLRPDTLQSFTDDAAEGIFNAVLWQLGGTPSEFADYGMPGDSSQMRRPPIWLSSVGRKSFIPIAVYPATDRDSGLYTLRVRDTTPPIKYKGTKSPAAPFHVGFLMLAVLVFILFAYRIYDASQQRPSYADVDRRTPSEEQRFGDLRGLIISRSLLIHEQLYTMVRDLAGSVGIGMIAVLMLATTRHELPGVGPGAKLVQLDSISFITIVFFVVIACVVGHSMIWIVRIIWRTWGPSVDYGWDRDWRTGRRPRKGGQNEDSSSATVEVNDKETILGAERRKETAPEPPEGYGDRGWRKKTLWWIEIAARPAIAVATVAFSFLVGLFILQAGNATVMSPELAARLFYHRAVQLTSGVSPAAPVLLGALGFGAWSLWHLSRVRLLKSPTPFDVLADYNVGEGLLRLLQRRVRSIRDRLFFVVADEIGLLVLVTIIVFAIILLLQFRRSAESLVLDDLWLIQRNSFDLLLAFCVVSAIGTLIWGLYRFMSLWSGLQQFLEDIAASPLLSAFERIPKRVSYLSQLTLKRTITREAVQRVAATQWRQLVEIHKGAKKLGPFCAPDPRFDESLDALFESSKPTPESGPFYVRPTAGADWLDPDVTDAVASTRTKQQQQERAAILRLGALFAAIQAFWHDEPRSVELDLAVKGMTQARGEGGPGSTSGYLRRLVTDPYRLWLVAAEDTAAVQVVAYIEWVLQHLRVLAFFLLVGVLLTTSLVASYPFQPQSTIKVVFIGVLIATVGSILYVGTKMNKDDVISRITRSDPGHLTWNASYVINILVFGVLPILAYVGSDVRVIREGVLSWLEPIARVISRH
jgi:hypothetical protein